MPSFTLAFTGAVIVDSALYENTRDGRLMTFLGESTSSRSIDIFLAFDGVDNSLIGKRISLLCI